MSSQRNTPGPGQGITSTAKSGSNTTLSISEHSRATGIGAETIDDFLDRQPRSVLIRLYEKPASCLAIFRLLPMMARQLIMHMLFLDVPLATDHFLAWVKKEARKDFDGAVEKLSRLSIVQLKSNGGGGKQQVLLLNAVYTDGMRRALTGGGKHRSFGVPCDTEDKNAVDVAFLDEYARTKWETILHYMVGSENSSTPREPVLYLLRRSNLMQPRSSSSSSSSSSGGLNITSRGFQFLLEDVNTQLWDLLLQYLDMAEERNMDLVEVLAFLFMLGSLELGRDYSTEELPETQLHMLEDFRDYGLVYQRKASSRRFYPTRLATTLTSAATPLLSGNGTKQEERGYIILETNYRLYAYTSNPLRVAVLSLFVTIKARFPNLVVGSITRDSVKSALANGITAEQIITYLTHHAHLQMHRNDPLLPVTVSDQIRLWEREKNRVQQNFGSLFTDFTSQFDFEEVSNYANQLGVLVWQDQAKRRFFVDEAGNEPVRDYIRRRRA
ncbi:probable TFB2 - TFIIH subunit (transcription/repair factor) [Melanopsichium pennsylvanicum]|uniref:RNA polymerase II transcription factor B subunit 2 n=2 Tax=Melanopsichium pennsylvanicum TaxID=63383 RepID=A0AAJ5C5C7_9BASI|nr:probable TFB2-TFIIH subunit (transcription/repair factor) [Melanopsichium pennsylvanicum 4]SNX84600.1 probable TFB2 - TFIIH subunit (transcription/repair factor) [Melanopsichium pennsylvanicum]